MLIMRRSPSLRFHLGSWIFLAEILLEAPAPAESPARETQRTLAECGSCARCLTDCPTGALVAPRRLRADWCISYLTIENKRSIPPELREQVGDWLFGCDICQEVCPFNARVWETRWPEFKANRGAGPWVSLEEILTIQDDDTFEKQFGHTPLQRPKRRGLLRNACVAAGNSREKSLLPALERLTGDCDPLIREHADWAVAKLRAS